MLQIQVLRNDTQKVKDRLAVKYFTQINLVDEIIALDDERKKIQQESDTLLSKVNAASKEIGALMAKGQKEEAEAKKQEVASFKEAQQPLADKLAETEKQLNDKLVLLPNLPSEKVPEGKAAADNVVIREGGAKVTLPETPPMGEGGLQSNSLICEKKRQKITHHVSSGHCVQV